MATDTQIKVRTAVALDRLLQAAARLADRFPDVEAPEIPTRLRYPEMLPLMQLTAIGDFLDAVDGALGGDAPSDEEQDAPDAEIQEMTRAELNAYAAENGIESPESFPNKAELIAAIAAADIAAESEEPS